MKLSTMKWTLSIALVAVFQLQAQTTANAVSTVTFQLTFPNTWGYLLGQSAATASETDSTAIRGKVGGLNGQALMGMYPSVGPLDVDLLPNQVLVGGATGSFSKVKDSAATYGAYDFQIAEFTYDSLSFPEGALPQGISPQPSGKLRIYATQVGDHYFVFVLTHLLGGTSAILSYSDAESALKTLVLTPNGAGIHTRLIHNRQQKRAGQIQVDIMGRQLPLHQVTKDIRPFWATPSH